MLLPSRTISARMRRFRYARTARTAHNAAAVTEAPIINIDMPEIADT